MEIKVKGISIRYEIFGEGNKTLLLLHGWGACVEAMAPIYQVLQQKYKVYVLDFPGETGKSDLPPVPWGVPEYGEMVKEFLEVLNIQKPNVIGHSFGGRVVIYLASKYPSLFDKMILTDSAGIKPKVSFQRKINAMKYQIRKMDTEHIYPKK